MTAVEETQYFLRVEITLIAEQLNDAIDRAFRLRMRAIQKNDLRSIPQIIKLEKSLRLFHSRLEKLKDPDAIPGKRKA